MVAEVEYWNWYDLFVNDIAGGSTVFIIMAFILIMFLCAKFRMPNSVTIMIMGIFAIIVSAFFDSILILTLIITGMLFGYAWKKFFTT